MYIGILTQPLHNNYGGLLQNYALQQVLNRLGHTTETIDHDSRVSPIRTLASRGKRFVCHAVMPKRYPKPRYLPTETELNTIRKNTNYFIDTYIRRTQPVRSSKGFLSIAQEKGYDAYVVGSDQCWRPRYSVFPKAMFLDFVKDRQDIRRIAYAASFGIDKWGLTERKTLDYKRLASLFDLVTVREDTGVRLCKDHLGVEATHVLDPTMLLDQGDYEKLVIKEKEPGYSGTLYHYILDPSDYKHQLINWIAKENDLKPFTVMPRYQQEIRTRSDIKNHIDDCIYASVTAWLRGFMDARMVIVDSFHGAVFSIIFNKPFWVFANSARGNTRFNSLLSMFHLEERLLTIGNTNVNDWNRPIDWYSVNQILQKEKHRSLQLLRNYLND